MKFLWNNAEFYFYQFYTFILIYYIYGFNINSLKNRKTFWKYVFSKPKILRANFKIFDN